MWGRFPKSPPSFLVGGSSLPLWKIWVRQLGWWHPIYYEKYIYWWLLMIIGGLIIPYLLVVWLFPINGNIKKNIFQTFPNHQPDFSDAAVRSHAATLTQRCLLKYADDPGFFFFHLCKHQISCAFSLLQLTTTKWCFTPENAIVILTCLCGSCQPSKCSIFIWGSWGWPPLCGCNEIYPDKKHPCPKSSTDIIITYIFSQHIQSSTVLIGQEQNDIISSYISIRQYCLSNHPTIIKHIIHKHINNIFQSTDIIIHHHPIQRTSYPAKKNTETNPFTSVIYLWTWGLSSSQTVKLPEDIPNIYLHSSWLNHHVCTVFAEISVLDTLW